jgi:hypothetical protein
MKFKKLATLAMSAMVVVAMGSTSVFAADPVPEADASKVKAADGAYLVKYLKKGTDVDAPNATFNFKFAGQDQRTINVEDKGEHKTAAKADYPADFTVAINANDMEAAGREGDTKKAISIAELFSGKTFKSAGEYIFKVTEEDFDFTADNNDETTENLEKDNQYYELHLYVVNNKNEDGTLAEGTHIDQVTVADQNGNKVDPSDVDPEPAEPTGDDPDPRADENYKADGFTFTNNYEVSVKDKEVDPSNPEDPTNPEYAGFGVTKVVAGEYASKTQDFEFTVTIVKPLGADSSITGGKYIVKEKNNEGNLVNVTKDFTYGEAFSVKIKDNQNFGISEMLLGSKVTILENGTLNYTPSVTGLIEGNGDLSGSLSKDVTVGTAKQGKNANFTNTMEDNNVTPTGIVINNLPYVLLIVIALGGIVLFTRKRRAE